MKNWLIGTVVVIGILVLIWATFTSIKAYDCWRNWSSTDLDWRVSKMTCQVKHPSIGWVPEKTIRFAE